MTLEDWFICPYFKNEIFVTWASQCFGLTGTVRLFDRSDRPYLLLRPSPFSSFIHSLFSHLVFFSFLSHYWSFPCFCFSFFTRSPLFPLHFPLSSFSSLPSIIITSPCTPPHLGTFSSSILLRTTFTRPSSLDNNYHKENRYEANPLALRHESASCLFVTTLRFSVCLSVCQARLVHMHCTETRGPALTKPHNTAPHP